MSGHGPPDKRRRPACGSGVVRKRVGETASSTTVLHTPPGYAEWAVVREAENIVLLEFYAVEALRALSTEQLRSLVWAGMLDVGWRRMFAELRDRNEAL